MKQFDFIDPNLQSPDWITKRETILKRDNYHCRYCNIDKDLDVHHVYYIIDKQPWEYPDNLLITLCRDCHKHWHDLYGLEYCTEEGQPLTLYLLGSFTKMPNTGYYKIPFELRNSENKAYYKGDTLTWEIDKILVNRHGTPLNYCLSHKQNGIWLIPYIACDGYHFKKDILVQLDLPR